MNAEAGILRQGVVLARTIPDRQVRASTTPCALSGTAGQRVNSKGRWYQTLLAAAPLMDAQWVMLDVSTYGEALPIACDDTGLGAATNRRVELWVLRLATDTPPSGN